MYNTNQFVPYGSRQTYYVPNYAINNYGTNMPVQDIRFLNSDQIKSFIPPLGSTVALIDRENSLLYLESADNFGNLSKLVYSFKKLENQAEIQNEEKQQLNFATKEDIESIRKELETIRKQSVNIQGKQNIQQNKNIAQNE